MSTRLVVIGGVAAGMSAAAKAKRENPKLEVIVYEQGSFISYAACGMPYWLAGDIADYHELIARTPVQMAQQGVIIHLNHRALAIDPEAHRVVVRDLQTGREFTEPYDRLILATGARPTVPLLPGVELPGVFGLRSLESGLSIQRFLHDQKPQEAVILGGGYLAVEMAETCRRLGMYVTLIVRSGQVLRSSLDNDMRAIVHAELTRHGVELVQGTPIALEGNGRVQAVVTTNGHYQGELVVLGLGVQPNVELAQAAAVTLGTSGAIATDETMRTNLPDLFAAGDCCEAFHRVLDRPDYLPLGTTANKQGRIAGTNAAGGHETFAGVVGTTVVRCFRLAIASTGLTAARARALGYDVQETRIQARDISPYFPGAADLYVKLVTDKKDRRLLGGQIIGEKGVAKRIDVLATALYHSMTVSELQQLDLSYAPPFAPVWDPILVAANVAAK
ncbi:MAG: FAD-dependent oxidoreductase [Anaerolineae bacterium]